MVFEPLKRVPTIWPDPYNALGTLGEPQNLETSITNGRREEIDCYPKAEGFASAEI
jgi:hypothetical protein